MLHCILNSGAWSNTVEDSGLSHLRQPCSLKCEPSFSWGASVVSSGQQRYRALCYSSFWEPFLFWLSADEVLPISPFNINLGVYKNAELSLWGHEDKVQGERSTHQGMENGRHRDVWCLGPGSPPTVHLLIHFKKSIGCTFNSCIKLYALCFQDCRSSPQAQL